MFDRLLSDPFSPWPPTLHFTPEVRAGIRAATDLEAGPGWDADPAEMDLDAVADEIFLNDPKLLSLLLQLDAAPNVEDIADVEHADAAQNAISAA